MRRPAWLVSTGVAAKIRKAVSETTHLSLRATHFDDQHVIRSSIALLTPFLALAIALISWRFLYPYAWFLFYPAVFVSALLGGRRLGLIATVISTSFIWWFFLPPAGSLRIEPRHLLAIGVFFSTGVAFAYFQERLTRAIMAKSQQQQLVADLQRMTELQQRLKESIADTRIFSALVENSSDFIGVADPEGKPTYLNPAGRRMVGLSPDDRVEDTTIPDYYTPDQRSFAESVIVESMQRTGRWQGETYFRHWQTGRAIPVSDRHFMVRDPETAEVLGMATITRDISEIRQVEEKLQRTNEELVEAWEFLENVLESSTEYSIIAKDLERRILAWNEGAARNYGYTASEVVGRSSDMLHDPEEVRSGAVAALHQQALEQGKATGLFHRRRKDGSEFVARVMITRRNDARGNAVGYLLVSHDVTAEQRQLERQRFLAEVGAALQASLDYTTTIDQIAKLVVGFMGDGCAIDVLEDRGALKRARVVHTDPGEAKLAKALEQFLPERPHPVWEVLDNGRPLLFKEISCELLRSIAKNQEHLSLLESLHGESAILVPILLHGRTIAVLTIVSCRADRRYGPEDLSLAEELARRASLALDNSRLYEVAQEAIQARDHVLGVVAHDLRNPLGTILVASTLLRRHAVGHEQRAPKPVDSIERAAKRMNRLIQDLLDVTRIEAQRLPIEAASVSARQTISEAVEAQRALAESASLELALDLEPTLPEVWADRDRLHQIFENLIGNAIKFTPPRGLIVVGASSRGAEVLFWIKDNGLGIAPSHLPHLFDRFWQKDEVRRRGTGLGLPIVKGLVEAHGGRVWVESTLGMGSSFYFTIPVANPRA
jgi:PAS domain S-box-containing protein